MKLYDAMTPNTLRVSVFLAEKGLDVPKERVKVLEGGTRTPEFMAMNSRGELPVLELDDGRIIAESVAICRYFELLHPEPCLMGSTPEEQAHIEMWNRRMEIHVFGSIGSWARHTFEFFADKVEQMPDYAASQMRLFDKNLAWFDEELAGAGPYAAGSTFTIADITGMAMLFVCDIAQKPISTELPHVKKWEALIRQRTSFTGIMAQAA